MFKKVFLDANIFIDVNDEKRDPDKNGLKVLDRLVGNDIAIYTSYDLITTIYYILSKKNKQEALTSVEEINKICTIIEFSNFDLQQTCNLMRENPTYKDLDDSIQYILAKNKSVI